MLYEEAENVSGYPQWIFNIIFMIWNWINVKWQFGWMLSCQSHRHFMSPLNVECVCLYVYSIFICLSEFLSKTFIFLRLTSHKCSQFSVHITNPEHAASILGAIIVFPRHHNKLSFMHFQHYPIGIYHKAWMYMHMFCVWATRNKNLFILFFLFSEDEKNGPFAACDFCYLLHFRLCLVTTMKADALVCHHLSAAEGFYLTCSPHSATPVACQRSRCLFAAQLSVTH